jgi:nitroreductase/NAD-dependent dihydropyrimidine dehydrogenase PreA subunit
MEEVLMAFFTVNEQLCNKDGICAKLCPAGIIKINEASKYPYVEPQDKESCIACGQCVSFCPQLACDVQAVASEKLDTKLLPSAQSVDTLLRSRRSIRMFRKDLVPEATLRELLTVASMAPSGTNKRCVRWLVISGRDKMITIADMIAKHLEAQSMTGVYETILEKYKSGNDVILRGASQLIIALIPKDWYLPEDGAIALSYLEIAAHGHGIGMCWAGFFTLAVRQYKPLRDYLGLTDEYVCGAQMTGYPMLQTKRIPLRPALEIEFL